MTREYTGEFSDVDAEIERLAVQADFTRGAELRYLHELGLPQQGLALDVGCGPGAVARRLGEAAPGLRIVGVDTDRTMLARAAAALPVLRADVAHLPFPDGTFDFCYARFLLRHLSDVPAALADVHRTLRAGGRMAVFDSDDGTLVVEPGLPAFYDVLQARHEGVREQGADPHLGRRLPGLLRATGLDGVRIRPVVVSSELIGRSAFARILEPVLDGVSPTRAPPPRVRAAREELTAWVTSDRSFGMMTLMMGSGRRSSD